MKRMVVVLLVCSTLIFSACSTTKNAEPADSTRTRLQTSSTSDKKSAANLADIIEKFKKDGLTVENSKSMTKEDFGMAPMSAKEAYIFAIQKDDTGNFINSRIFSFEDSEDMDKTKTYYDNLGKESAVAFSYTASNDKKKVLMQFNGDLPQDLVQKYVESADLTLTPTSFMSSTESSDSTSVSTIDPAIDSNTTTSTPQGAYGDHNANIRNARYQEAIENGATEQEANDYAEGKTTTYKTQEPDTQQTTAQQDADSLSLTDFVNKYGMSPVAWKVQNGMSEEEALRSTQHKTSGEVQLGIMKYGIQP